MGDGDFCVRAALGFVSLGDLLELVFAGWGGQLLGVVVGVEAVADLLELLLRGEAGAGKHGELIVEGMEIVVDEDGRAVLAMVALQREGDEVAQLGLAARVDGQPILGREEAVVARELHGTRRAREQSEAHLAGELRGNRGLKEDPDVGAGAGARELDEWIESVGSTLFGVGEGVLLEVAVVEVTGEEIAGVIGKQGVESGEELGAGEVLGDDRRVEWAEVLR